MKLYIMESNSVYNIDSSEPHISIDPRVGVIVYGFNGSIIIPRYSEFYKIVTEDKDYASKLFNILEVLMVKEEMGTDYLFYQITNANRVFNMGMPSFKMELSNLYHFLSMLKHYGENFLADHGLYISRHSSIDLAHKNFLWILYELIDVLLEFNAFKNRINWFANMFIDQNYYPPILIRTYGVQPSKYSILLTRPWARMLESRGESYIVEVPLFNITIPRDEKALFKELITICKLSVDIGSTIYELSAKLKDTINSFINKMEELTNRYDVVYIVHPTHVLDKFLERIRSIIEKSSPKFNHLPQFLGEQNTSTSKNIKTVKEAR